MRLGVQFPVVHHDGSELSAKEKAMFLAAVVGCFGFWVLVIELVAWITS